MLKSALNRTAVPTRHEAALKPIVTDTDHSGLAGANESEPAIMHDATVPAFDSKYAVPVNTPRSFPQGERTKRGRPRQDGLSDKVKQLREDGHSWGEIQRKLNKETGIERTAGAYRNLMRSRQKPEEV